MGVSDPSDIRANLVTIQLEIEEKLIMSDARAERLLLSDLYRHLRVRS